MEMRAALSLNNVAVLLLERGFVVQGKEILDAAMKIAVAVYRQQQEICDKEAGAKTPIDLTSFSAKALDKANKILACCMRQPKETMNVRGGGVHIVAHQTCPFLLVQEQSPRDNDITDSPVTLVRMDVFDEEEGHVSDVEVTLILYNLAMAHLLLARSWTESGMVVLPGGIQRSRRLLHLTCMILFQRDMMGDHLPVMVVDDAIQIQHSLFVVLILATRQMVALFDEETEPGWRETMLQMKVVRAHVKRLYRFGHQGPDTAAAAA